MEQRPTRRANGPAIRALREVRGLRLYELARQAGISNTYLGNIEKQRCDSSVRVLKELAEALGVDVAVIVSDPELTRALTLSQAA